MFKTSASFFPVALNHGSQWSLELNF